MSTSAVLEQRNCVGCAGPMTGRRGNAKFCSLRCSEIARGVRLAAPLDERQCELPGCDATFRPKRASTHCCSEAHGKQLWNRQARSSGYYTDRVALRCEACGSEVLRRRSARWDQHRPVCKNGMCRTYLLHGFWPHTPIPSRHPVVRVWEIEVWRPPQPTKTWTVDGPRSVDCACLYCSERFTFDRARSFGAQPKSSWCSLRCLRKHNKAVRRLRERASAEVVNPQRVFERDRWRCHICKRRVPRDKRTPHPLAATLDHIVPVADDGDHTYANIRTAHNICNSRRGDRGGGEQLSLIG